MTPPDSGEHRDWCRSQRFDAQGRRLPCDCKPDSGEREVRLSAIPDDPPDGQALHCPDCKSWATIRENAHYHALKTGHGIPTLGPQPPRDPDTLFAIRRGLAHRILAALEGRPALASWRERDALAAELRAVVERKP